MALAAGIGRTLIVTRALPTPAAPRTATVAAPARATENVDPGLSGYAVIAARNLFNPARSETAAAGSSGSATTGSSSPGPKGSSRSCCVTLPSPRHPPSPRRRRSRPRQGRQRHHRRCHHRSLRQRQSERADPLLPYLHLPLQEFQIQEGLQAEIVSTSQIRVDNRPADDPHSVARFECFLCPEQRRRSPLPLGIARQGATFKWSTAVLN